MISRRQLAISTIASCIPFATKAQGFPAKPVRLVVPFPPGSVPDVLARLIADSMAAIIEQPVVVDNKAGAGGTIGADAVAKAPADGYTLLMGDSGPLSIAPWLYAKVPYTTRKDFLPIASLVTVPLVLVVPGTSKINTIGDLIAKAKAEPGQLLYGSLGVGSIHHLAAEVFASATGIKLTHVPYKSNGELASAVINGDIQMAFSGIPAVEGFIKEKRVRPIGISTSRRSAVLPEVKTIAEQGVNGYDVAPTQGILAPAGVSPDRVKVLEDAIIASINSPKVTSRLDSLGMIKRTGKGSEYEATVSAELERFGRVIKQAQIQPQ